jgi:competence protein ComEA
VPDGPWERVLEVFERWRGDVRAGLAVLVAIAVVAGVVWYRIGVGSGDPPPRPALPATSGPSGAVAASTTTVGGDVIVVHVAGAVATPGVVELDADARVIDAVEAAGGADDDADLDRLNLAARLADGERILVQHVGDPADPGSSATGEPAASNDTSPATGLVNVNTATSTELEALPGIGPALAAAIIAERARRGRFRNVQELRDVRGIGEKRFADLAGLVTV